MACCGVSFLLGFALPYRPGASSFFVPVGPAVCHCFYACALHVVVVLLCVVVGASSVFWSVLVFSSPYYGFLFVIVRPSSLAFFLGTF